MTWLRVLAAGALLVLVGCAQRQLSPEEVALLACAKYERTLTTLTTLYETGHLSGADAHAVDRWERQITPICSAEEPPTGEAVLILLDQALMEMLLIQPQGE